MKYLLVACAGALSTVALGNAVGKSNLRANQAALKAPLESLGMDATGGAENEGCSPFGPKGTFTCGPTCDMECMEDEHATDPAAKVEEPVEEEGEEGEEGTDPVTGDEEDPTTNGDGEQDEEGAEEGAEEGPSH